MSEGTAVKFAGRDWIWLITLICGATVANMAAIHRIGANASDAMQELDEKWQIRSMQMTRDIRKDISDVRASIPPDWFREMVESNQNEIRRIEREFTRDFIRKNEHRDIHGRGGVVPVPPPHIESRE